jgi:hypothetical protein
MSKTNHQRNYKSTYDPKHFQRNYTVGGNSIKSVLADRTVSADACLPDTEIRSAKKRTRKNVAGAKKYVRTRIRFHENAATKKAAIVE